MEKEDIIISKETIAKIQSFLNKSIYVTISITLAVVALLITTFFYSILIDHKVIEFNEYSQIRYPLAVLAFNMVINLLIFFLSKRKNIVFIITLAAVNLLFVALDILFTVIDNFSVIRMLIDKLGITL